MTTIVLLSNSMVKKQAFFTSNFGKITQHIKCINAKTDTPQPIGNKNGYLVACQRINNYIAEHYDMKNIIIAIESYLDKVDDIWYDKCVVVIRWKDTIIHTVSKTLVSFDNSLMDMLIQNSKEMPHGRDVTLGSIIGDIYNTASDNWYECYNKFDRVHHIKETINQIIIDNKLKKLVYDNIPKIQDFPKKGILFSDVISMFSDKLIVSIIMYYIKQLIIIDREFDEAYDYIIGLESRGFIIGSMIANELGCGFVPIRKAGKLPGETYQAKYIKEYGEDVFEIQKNALRENARILVVDDILATGGSLMAAKELLSNYSNIQIDYFVMEDVLHTFKDENVMTLF